MGAACFCPVFWFQTGATEPGVGLTCHCTLPRGPSESVQKEVVKNGPAGRSGEGQRPSGWPLVEARPRLGEAAPQTMCSRVGSWEGLAGLLSN